MDEGRGTREEGRWTKDEGRPRLNPLCSFSAKNLTGQGGTREGAPVGGQKMKRLEEQKMRRIDSHQPEIIDNFFVRMWNGAVWARFNP